MTDKLTEMTSKVNQLNKLLETANNPKILWEEIKIVSDKTFTLQDEIMAIIDEMETSEKDLIKLQSLFDAREIVWDVVAKIATRELDIKEKATKSHQHAHEKTPSSTCECGHDHVCECHHENDDECECHHDECKCGGKK